MLSETMKTRAVPFDVGRHARPSKLSIPTCTSLRSSSKSSGASNVPSAPSSAATRRRRRIALQPWRRCAPTRAGCPARAAQVDDAPAGLDRVVQRARERRRRTDVEHAHRRRVPPDAVQRALRWRVLARDDDVALVERMHRFDAGVAKPSMTESHVRTHCSTPTEVPRAPTYSGAAYRSTRCCARETRASPDGSSVTPSASASDAPSAVSVASDAPSASRSGASVATSKGSGRAGITTQ